MIEKSDNSPAAHTADANTSGYFAKPSRASFRTAIDKKNQEDRKGTNEHATPQSNYADAFSEHTEQTQTTLYAELLGQTGKIEWQEIERFFAKGQVVRVAPELDLVAVAMAMVEDDVEKMRPWHKQGQVGLLDNQTARHWAEVAPTLWAVVVSPWILVQQASSKSN